MATINTTGAGGNADRLNPTIQTTLGRLGRALTIRGGNADQAVGSAGDSVQISPAAASASASGVGQIGAILADLESLVAQAAQDGAGAEVRAEAQRRIDEAVAAISQIAGSGSVGEVGSRLDSAPGYSVVNRHDAISNVAVSSELKQDERLDVALTVLHSAHPGGFFLSFGGPAIDLGTGSSFVFEVGGVGGARTLSFASGTQIADIAAAINTFEDETGVRAVTVNRPSGRGILLNSLDLSADSFVAVRVIDDGTIRDAGGIFSVRDGDPFKPDVSSGIEFSSLSAQDGLTDFGRDFVAEINGVAAEVNGNRFSASLLGGRVEVAFDYDHKNRVEQGSFPFGIASRALTVIGGRPQPSFITARDELAENVRVENRALDRGETFEVIFDASGQAERAGIFLRLASFAHSTVVAGDVDFTIEGPDGTASFALLSSQPLASVLEAINEQSETLGVDALLVGNSLQIVSKGFGEDQHVSVKIDEADVYRGTAGRLLIRDDGGAWEEWPTLSINELASEPPIVDFGRDVQMYSNFHQGGIQFSSTGRHIVGDALDGDVHFEFDLGLPDFGPDALVFGTARHDNFHAFTIHGADGVNVDGPIDDIPLPGAAPVSQGLAGYVSGGSDAGEFVGALDAIRLLRGRGDGGVTTESLAALRRDVIAGAGKSLGINTEADAQRALDLLGGGDS